MSRAKRAEVAHGRVGARRLDPVLRAADRARLVRRDGGRPLALLVAQHLAVLVALDLRRRDVGREAAARGRRERGAVCVVRAEGAELDVVRVARLGQLGEVALAAFEVEAGGEVLGRDRECLSWLADTAGHGAFLLGVLRAARFSIAR